MFTKKMIFLPKIRIQFGFRYRVSNSNAELPTGKKSNKQVDANRTFKFDKLMDMKCFLDLGNVLNPRAHFESGQKEAIIIDLNGNETNSASEMNEHEHLMTWQMGNQATTWQSTSKHLIDQVPLEADISNSTEICNGFYFIQWNLLH